MNELKQGVLDLQKKFDEVKSKLNLGTKQLEIERLEKKSQEPNLWDDPQRAKTTLQKLSDLKSEVSEVNELEGKIQTILELSTDESLVQELSAEFEMAEKELKKLTLSSFLSGKYDGNNALVSIHAGQGGTEAMDWANILFRMYTRFCERKSWSANTIDVTPGEEAGIKSITFKVGGSYAYGYLKGEAGTHRLVRQSPFNADKLRQTSFALVEVLPELTEMDSPEIEIKDEDIEWQFYRSSSQGGQNVQKVSTAVRLTHKPSGIVITSQNERFQEQNRKIALGILRSKLWAKKLEDTLKTKTELKGEYRPASWGTQIRSYVLHPYKMVKDLRTAVETGNPDAVLDGEIDEFIEAELKV